MPPARRWPLGRRLRPRHRGALSRAAGTPDLWPLWDAIACPTLVLRGAQSDLLSSATARAMTAARARRPRVVEFAGVGHAPMLLAQDQVDPVVGFLSGPQVRTPKRTYNLAAHDRAAPTDPTSFLRCRSRCDCRPCPNDRRTAPETRPSRVAAWLTETLTREPGFAARVIGEALAATNRVSLSYARRLDLTEQYWKSAALLWPRLERQFTRASHPLQGDNLEAAKASLTLAQRIVHRLQAAAAPRGTRGVSLWGGPRRTVALVRRAFQATSRVLANSYLAVRAGAAANVVRRARHLHVHARAEDPPAPGDARPARRDARAPLRPVAAARARESVRLPAEPARAPC